MIRTLSLLACVVVAVWTQTPVTTPAPSTGSFLYDLDHDAVVYITDTMCYEYHMKHNDAAGAELEAMVMELAMTGQHLHEMNEHQLDHFSEDLQAACAGKTTYRV